MTIIVKIKNGARYTLWNVTSYTVTLNNCTASHSDYRPDSVIQGFIESVKRRDSI